MKKIILTSLICLALFSSCKKENVTPTNPPVCGLSKANLLGSYRITAISYKKNEATPDIDEFALYKECERDDLTIFNANNTTTYSDIGMLCNPLDNGVGTWSLNGNKLTIDGDIGTVTDFTCNGGMKLSYSTNNPGEITIFTIVRVP